MITGGSGVPFDQLERFVGGELLWPSSHILSKRRDRLCRDQRWSGRKLGGSAQQPAHDRLRERSKRRADARPLGGKIRSGPIRHTWPTGCSVRPFAQIPREWLVQSSESFA